MHRAHILDLLPIAIAVLDPRGRISYANRSATELLRAGSVLSTTDGILTLRSNAHSRALTDALCQLASGATQGPIGITIARAKRHPVSLALLTLGHDSAPRRRILAILCDPDRANPPQISLLQQLFDFTPMEASVASLMLQYSDTGEIAERLAISNDTVRKHLKAMFAKTNCRHQRELLQIILFSPALLFFGTSNGSNNSLGTS